MASQINHFSSYAQAREYAAHLKPNRAVGVLWLTAGSKTAIRLRGSISLKRAIKRGIWIVAVDAKLTDAAMADAVMVGYLPAYKGVSLRKMGLPLPTVDELFAKMAAEFQAEAEDYLLNRKAPAELEEPLQFISRLVLKTVRGRYAILLARMIASINYPK